jgi:hypothetical protein
LCGIDEETIIESVFEIASNGEYRLDAEALLRSELIDAGYSISESEVVINVAKRSASEPDRKEFAIGLHRLLKSTPPGAQFLADMNELYAGCLLLKS